MEKQEIIPQAKPSVPGFGVSGLVMCPFFKGACLKGGCELWVELKQGDIFVARCTLAWLTVLSIETRGAIEKLNPQKSGGENAPT
jgi:hypothetical protein